MKKYLLGFLVVCALFLTTACGKEKEDDKKGSNNDKYKTLTCTNSETSEDGTKVDTEAVVKYDKDEKVISVTETASTQVDKNMADLTFNMSKALTEAFNKIEGISMEASKENDTTIKIVTSVDYTKLDLEAIKEAFGDEASDSLYGSKDITLSQLKKDALKGYTCK